MRTVVVHTGPATVRPIITKALAGKIDVIGLAQVSMARLIASLTGLKMRVLSSSQSGVEAVRAALARLH